MSEKTPQEKLEELKAKKAEPKKTEPEKETAKKAEPKADLKEEQKLASEYSVFAELMINQRELKNLGQENRIKEDAKKLREELKDKFKDAKGHKPLHTGRVALGSEIVLLIKGYPVPEIIYKKFEEMEDSRHKKYWFGK
jgi:hypothetical protein